MKKRYIKLLNYVIGKAHSYPTASCSEAYAWNYIAYLLTRAYNTLVNGLTEVSVNDAETFIDRAANSANGAGVNIEAEDYYFWVKPAKLVEPAKNDATVSLLMSKKWNGEHTETEFTCGYSMANRVIAAVNEEVSDYTNCNNVFARCQNGIGDERYEELDIRSMSVGDIVSINNERYYMCDNLGWLQVYMTLKNEVYTLIPDAPASYPIPLV